MPTISTKLVSNALKLTAFVNGIAGIAGILTAQLSTQLLYGPDVILEGHLLRFYLIIWAFVGSMGIGYWVASKNPSQQSGLLIAGGVGKLTFVLICIEMLSNNLATMLLLAPVLFDAPMGLLFLAYLNGQRSQA